MFEKNKMQTYTNKPTTAIFCPTCNIPMLQCQHYGCCASNAICKMRLGYTNKYLLVHIDSIRILNTGKDTDLHIDKPVYAIHIADVKEVIK